MYPSVGITLSSLARETNRLCTLVKDGEGENKSGHM